MNFLSRAEVLTLLFVFLCFAGASAMILFTDVTTMRPPQPPVTASDWAFETTK